MKLIVNQLDNMEKRGQVLEKKAKDLQQEALKQKKAKNTRAAVLALKKKKLIEQESNKINGMRILLEQQKLQLDCINLS